MTENPSDRSIVKTQFGFKDYVQINMIQNIDQLACRISQDVQTLEQIVKSVKKGKEIA